MESIIKWHEFSFEADGEWPEDRRLVYAIGTLGGQESPHGVHCAMWRETEEEFRTHDTYEARVDNVRWWIYPDELLIAAFAKMKECE